MTNTPSQPITIQPIVSYPRQAEVGKTYLMTVDIQSTSTGDWPYIQEDQAMRCILDTEPLFSHQSLGESVIVLNRFGGTYGPASFVITAKSQPKSGDIAVKLVNEQGLIIHNFNLSDIEIVQASSEPIQSKKIRSQPIAPSITPTETDSNDIPLYNLPPRSANFIGRENMFVELEAQLDSTENAVSIQALTGLGGIGKTQLALEYAYRHFDKYELIWWLNASKTQNLIEGYAQLGNSLNLPTVSRELSEQAKSVRLWLRQADIPWLLIIDDAELSPLEFTGYLPNEGQGHILVTSRNLMWPSEVGVFNVDLWTQAEAIEFLFTRLPRECLVIPNEASEETTEQTSMKEEDSTEDMAPSLSGKITSETESESHPLNQDEQILQLLEDLADALGYLPLALELAAAYMEETFTNIADFLTLFKIHQQESWIGEETSNNYLLNVTWQIAFNQVQEQEGAAELLSLCSFLAPDNIPLGAFKELQQTLQSHEFTNVLTQNSNWDAAISTLIRASFLTATENAFSTHNLVQVATRDDLKPRDAVQWIEICCRLLREIYRLDIYDVSTWKTAGQLLPHLQAILQLANKYNVENEEIASLNNAAGFYLQNIVGIYAAAQPYFEQSLTIYEKVLGSNHPNTALALNNLGGLLQAMGQLTAAQPYFEQSLTIYEKVLGSNHPNTALALNNLGGLLQAMGQLTAAQPYYELALTIYEKVLGSDHPQTASSLNNLGYLLSSLGQLDAARPYFERALAIYEKALGPDHPEVATSLNNLGYLLQGMGRLEETRPYYERALAIREKMLGSDHPDTATSLNNLGALLQEMRDYTSARPFFERTLAIRESTLGAEHPDTALSLNNLGLLLRVTGHYEEARVYYARSLDILQKVLGASHPDVATTLNNIGTLLQAMGNYWEARPYYERALTISQKVLGFNHPNTKTIYENLESLSLNEQKSPTENMQQNELEKRRISLAEEMETMYLQLNQETNNENRFRLENQINFIEKEIKEIENRLRQFANTQEINLGEDTVSGSKYSINISGGSSIFIGDQAVVTEASISRDSSRKLVDLIARHYNLEELRTLCFDLAVKYEDLAGESRVAKVRELVFYMQRHGRIADLRLACQESRPTVSWN